MTIPQQILTIVAVVLGTMTTRFLPFLFFPEGKEPPASKPLATFSLYNDITDFSDFFHFIPHFFRYASLICNLG